MVVFLRSYYVATFCAPEYNKTIDKLVVHRGSTNYCTPVMDHYCTQLPFSTYGTKNAVMFNFLILAKIHAFVLSKLRRLVPSLEFVTVRKELGGGGLFRLEHL